MNIATIVRFEPDVKVEAQKKAKELGLSLSGYINRLIKDHVRTKKADYSDEAHPTQFMIDELRKSEEDVKAGRVISFESIDNAIDYVSSLIDEDDKKLTRHLN